MNSNDKSEITQLRQQQTMQEEAALLGLYGLASGFSRHAFIEARMQQGATYIVQLLEEGKHEEAQHLMNTRAWGQQELEGLEEGQDGRCHTLTPNSPPPDA